MNPAFFVQNNYVHRLTMPVARYAWERNIVLHDRSSTSELDPDHCGIDWDQHRPVLPVGSVQFLRKLRASSLSRYVLGDEGSFDARVWLKKLGPFMLNADGKAVPAGDVAPMLRSTGILHVRPLSEHKAFTARSFDLESWSQTARDKTLSDELMCWVSPFKSIEAEWRLWLVDKELVAASQYRKDGQMHEVEGAPLEVQQMASVVALDWLPAPCVVLDVALSEGRYHVLEFNPIHSSGWYAVDVTKVLDAWMSWSMKHFAE